MSKVFVVIENIDGSDEIVKIFAKEAPAVRFMEELQYETKGENPVCVVPMEVE